MDHKKIRAIGAAVVAILWVVITCVAWFGPTKEMSESERRPLKQMPEITLESILDRTFMDKFDGYSLDQFPLRDRFRQIKSLFHNYVMNYSDNNDIYIADGYAVKQEYPLNQASIDHAIDRFSRVYEKLLTQSEGRIWFTVVPDKGYYLAEGSGHLAPDYSAMFSQLEAGMPWAQFVDITDTLAAEDYYRTDTHWRQEALIPTAQKLCQAMGVTPPKAEDYTVKQVERPFYGVYYGQAALPMAAESIYLMESPLLSACQVMDYETGKYGQVYDMTKLESKDLYDLYLSGAKSLLTIENPNAATDKELIIFRDSFGSSIAPLLVQDYAKVTLVDIRYLNYNVLGHYLEFNGQDVLFLYSTLVLNNSNTIK